MANPHEIIHNDNKYKNVRMILKFSHNKLHNTDYKQLIMRDIGMLIIYQTRIMGLMYLQFVYVSFKPLVTRNAQGGNENVMFSACHSNYYCPFTDICLLNLNLNLKMWFRRWRH